MGHKIEKDFPLLLGENKSVNYWYKLVVITYLQWHLQSPWKETLEAYAKQAKTLQKEIHRVA